MRIWKESMTFVLKSMRNNKKRYFTCFFKKKRLIYNYLKKENLTVLKIKKRKSIVNSLTIYLFLIYP